MIGYPVGSWVSLCQGSWHLGHARNNEAEFQAGVLGIQQTLVFLANWPLYLGGAYRLLRNLGLEITLNSSNKLD